MLKKLSFLSIVFVVIISLILGYFIRNLQFNYVFESFFPTDDPDLEYYKQFEELFETDNNYLLIGLVNKPSVFDSAFLYKVTQLTQSISKTDHVKSVASLTSMEKPVISPAGYFEIPVIHVDAPERYASDSTRIYRDEWLLESLISRDASATAVILKHEQLSGKEGADSLVSNIRKAIDDLGFQKSHLAGKAYAQGVFIEKMQYELAIFLSASVVLVIIFLWVAFRSISGVLVPLIVVLLSTIWILGFMAMTGKTLDILMVLLPTIMFIVGMSDVVHIMTKYIEQLRVGDSKSTALVTTLKEVGLATFLTSLTTAVGFATLLTASIKPIQEFGIYTAAGVFFAFIVAFTLLPACLYLIPRPKVSYKMVHRSSWFMFLSRSFIKVARNGKTIIGINFLLIIISLIGIFQIRINTFLIEDLPSDDPLKQDFTFFDTQFGGSRPFEITATIKKAGLTVYDPQILIETDSLQKHFTSLFGPGGILSPVTVVKGLNQAINGGAAEAYRLPSTEKEWKRMNKYLPRILKRHESSGNITAKENTIGRISTRIGDIGSAISLEKTKELQLYIREHTDTSRVAYKITGTSNLIDKNNEYLARNMFEGLGIAFFVVAIIAGLLFKSLRMVIITLVPNVIPLLVIAGIMGISGITLKLSTSIVFSIAFGIAVDDTIHFISKLKIELSKGKPLLYALKRTYLSTGKAIIVTSIILSGGFLILLLSSFGGTFYTGLLVSLTLVFALIIDLTLLPVMILLFFKSKGEPRFTA
ncbi:MMPL family transporter [Fulvivirga ulvae]|uniref:efflux RND transporter permease subunit n=1 Tax=Fulvivirga ulvae TaxID=2904245 RepID=UPI001F16B3A7|nr:MMPL family transporter [Fulvivirga ulvae]UII30894.1 MMPL family transporter [Fulvivirga ulvae]